MITGLKDLDREILSKISDEELIKIWSINKKFYYDVCDNNFLRRRLNKYTDIEKYKNSCWKQFFINFTLYTCKMKKEKDFTYIEGDFKRQYVFLNYYSIDMLFLKSVEYGELSLLCYALEKGANIHLYNDGALYTASETGNLKIVQYLVDKGADIHTSSTLRRATDLGHFEIVQYLIEKGADTRPALEASCMSGHLNIVKYVVEKGADIHVDNELPLILSVRYNRFDVIKYLVESGANIHIYHGHVFNIARRNGVREIIKYLESRN